MILAVDFQRTRFTRVFDEARCAIQLLRCLVVRRDRQLDFLHEGACMAYDSLHDGRRHARSTSARPDIHSYQHALVPEFRALRHD